MIRNLHALKNISVLFFLVGHPKIPFLEIPFSLIIFSLSIKDIFFILNNKTYRRHIYSILCFSIYFFFRCMLQDDATSNDLFFVTTLIYKTIICILIAKAFHELLIEKESYLYTYMFFQITLIMLSAFYATLYDFLLTFQTNSAINVFENTFGIRSMGFGVLHNEGVAFLTLFYCFLIYKKSNIPVNILSISIYTIAFSSRMSIAIIGITQTLQAPLKLLVSIFILMLIYLTFDTSSGQLAEVYEVLNNYINNGTISSKSTDMIAEMPYIPDNLATLIIGDGKFLSENGFYMGTDIGFSRIIFFGGVIGLIFYLFIFFSPLASINYKNKDIKFYALLINIIIIFIITNIKGINIQNWAFIVTALISRKQHKGMNTK